MKNKGKKKKKEKKKGKGKRKRKKKKKKKKVNLRFSNQFGHNFLNLCSILLTRRKMVTSDF